MVNTLLDFSRLEGGLLKLTFHPVDLSKLTADLASLFRSAIERGNIQFIVNCDVDRYGPEQFYTVLDLFEKIIFNLIGNSFKYCLAGTIEVSVKYSATEVVIAVQDTGCGIEECELEKIFEKWVPPRPSSAAIGLRLIESDSTTDSIESKLFPDRTRELGSALHSLLSWSTLLVRRLLFI